MRGKSRRIATSAVLATALSFSLAASSQAGVTIGSSLTALPSAGEGLCTIPAGRTAQTCTYLQVGLAAGHGDLGRGGLSPVAGMVVDWQVRSAAASPATSAVSVRLRILDKGISTPFYPLPLTAGTRDFPANLLIEKGDRLALETKVEGTGAGLAYAPIAAFAPGIGVLDEWIPPYLRVLDPPADATREGTELLLSAEIDTDRQPPRTKLTYPQRQDFLSTREVLVRFRCNEGATAIASGQLEFPNGKRGAVVYGLYGTRRQVEPGQKMALRLRLPRKTWEAALQAQENGKRVVVKVTVSAEDYAGNRSGSTVAAIRPKRG
jgi:hypothetical protein